MAQTTALYAQAHTPRSPRGYSGRNGGVPPAIRRLAPCAAAALALLLLLAAQNALRLTTASPAYLYELLSALELYAALCLLYFSLRLRAERRKRPAGRLFALAFSPALPYCAAALAGAPPNALGLAASAACVLSFASGIICAARAPAPAAGNGSAEAGRQACDGSGVFSARERQVVRLIAQGMTAREAAEALCISCATVKTHLQHVYGKAHVRNRAELVRYLGEAAPALLFPEPAGHPNG